MGVHEEEAESGGMREGVGWQTERAGMCAAAPCEDGSLGWSLVSMVAGEGGTTGEEGGDIDMKWWTEAGRRRRRSTKLHVQLSCCLARAHGG